MEEVYAGKCLFLTGATGFLGKIFVLIRSRKGVQPAVRLQNEIINSPIFDRLRRERGKDFEAFAASKLYPVAGDVTSPGLGLSDEDARLLRDHVQITIHSAATVQFNEPLEVAVEMNCIGALNALDFVQSCPHVLCHLHVSTAYVNSNLRTLHIKEELYPLDFNAREAIDAVINASPSELERLSVNLMGTYPNTYALTKSMTEHLLVQTLRESTTKPLPLVIYRPTIIGASWKEPVPGWVDQIAGAGAIFLAAGMGVLTMLPGDPRNIADLVPVDLAVNSLLLSICTKIKMSGPPSHRQHQQFQTPPLIVHCGTSDPRQNPLRWRVPVGLVPEYFRKNPPVKGLFPAKFHMIPTHQHFQTKWFFSYALPSSVYSTVANKSGHPHHVKQAARLWQLTWRARTLVELFKPFTENQWIFVADSNELLKSYATNDWWLDSHQIVWERYVINFCVGLKKYMLHEDVIDVDIEGVEQTQLALSTGRMLAWDPDHHAISFPGLLSDVSWAYTSSRKPGYTKSGLLGRFMGLTGWKEGMNHEASHVPRQHVESIGSMRNSILESQAVREAIATKAEELSIVVDDVEKEAAAILDKMTAQMDYRSVRKFGWLLRKVCRRMYDQIHVDEKGLMHIREILGNRKGSVVLVPTHRSYIDFLLMSYVFFAYNIPVPYIAAGEDFMHMGYLTKIFRESGAYFIRRSFSDDPLYTAVFREYTQYLVSKGHTVEFFIEGSRSRSGKQLHPKFGILSTVVDCFLAEKVDNLYIVPVTIDYEKPLEVLLHQNEVLGEGKIRESLGALVKSVPVLRKKFGSISVQFGDPIDLKDYVAAQLDIHADQFISSATLVENLAYEITDALITRATCTMSHVVATILLMYRHGISKKELVQQSNWLRMEILKRGGRVMGTQGRSPAIVVEHALEMLQELVCTTRRKGHVEPAITSREQYPNMIGLGYYRNKILHWFNREGVLACAYHALDVFNASDSSTTSSNSAGVDATELLDGAGFLHEMLMMEFVRKDCKNDRQELTLALQQLEAQQTLERNAASKLCVGSTGQPLVSLLCAVIWPFIDSYWVAITSLFALRAHVEISLEDLLKRIQWLAETMYHEKLISFYESCSLETLQNAITLLEHWNVIERHAKMRKRRTGPTLIRLTPQYEQENELELLALRVAKFRKLPHGTIPTTGLTSCHRESHLIAMLPALSKM